MADNLRYFTLDDFKKGKARDAIVAPAVRGAMERNAQANAMGPGGDPRLQAAQQINMERAKDAGLAMAPAAAGMVGGPLAGAAIGGGVSLMQGHGPVRAAVDTALGGLAGGGLRLLMGGRAAAPTVGALMSEATPAAEAAAPVAEAAAARAAAPTVSTLMSEAPQAARPFVKTIEPLTPESVLEKVAKLREMGLSRGQIIASLKETHGLKESVATKVMKMLEEAGR